MAVRAPGQVEAQDSDRGVVRGGVLVAGLVASPAPKLPQ
jgi:hypothetical protein